MSLKEMFIAESPVAVGLMANKIAFSEMSDINMSDQCLFLISNRKRRKLKVTTILTDLKSLSQPSTSHCQSLPWSPPLRFFFRGSSLFFSVVSNCISASRSSCNLIWALRLLWVANVRPLHDGYRQVGGWLIRICD